MTTRLATDTDFLNARGLEKLSGILMAHSRLMVKNRRRCVPHWDSSVFPGRDSASRRVLLTAQRIANSRLGQYDSRIGRVGFDFLA